jgi:glutaminyl-peptide cyclotransferase
MNMPHNDDMPFARGLSLSFCIAAMFTVFLPAQAQVPAIPAGLPVDGYRVEHVYPHDAQAFTQGLQFVNGVFYEGTGLNGRSSIRKVKIETGEVLQRRDVPSEHFGEGITVWKNELIELTWRSQIALVYDRETFEPRRTFSYTGEGWGLTEDGTNLIMSDGSNQLRVLDPATFSERRRISVTAGGAPLRNLNELEYVKGQILANVWLTDYVARIAPDSGRVSRFIDLRGLLTPAERAAVDAQGGVLNGIAYDAARDRLFVTGKLWPKVFEITVVEKGR